MLGIRSVHQHQFLPSKTTVGLLALAVAIVIVLAILTTLNLRSNELPQPGRTSAYAAPRSGALDHFNSADLLIPIGDLHSGGPGKDGIPALSNPKTVPTARARFLKPTDRVISVTVQGQTRAYPLRLLNWHEVINDTLGKVPIAVIYCPLCDSVSILDRRSSSGTFSFGVSGLLYNSNLVMYDRNQNALWSQVRMTAISGPRADKSLPHLPFELLRFGTWKKTHPDATVVSTNTGHRRDYSRNPYAAYFRTNQVWFPLTGRDPRLPTKARVIGLRIGKTVRAYPLSELRKAPDGQLTQTFESGQLTLRAGAADGEVRVLSLPKDARVIHTFWFAWAAIHPHTDIWKYQSVPTDS